MSVYTDHVPRHTRVYADLAGIIATALETFAREVREGSFPSAEHSATMNEETLAEALRTPDG